MNSHQRRMKRREQERLGQPVAPHLMRGGDKTRKACEELVARGAMTPKRRDEILSSSGWRARRARKKLASQIEAVSPVILAAVPPAVEPVLPPKPLWWRRVLSGVAKLTPSFRRSAILEA